MAIRTGHAIPIVGTVALFVAIGCLASGWLVARRMRSIPPFPQHSEIIGIAVGKDLRLVGMPKLDSYWLARPNGDLVCPPYSQCGDCTVTRLGVLGPEVLLVEGTAYDKRCVKLSMHWIVDNRRAIVTAFPDQAELARGLKEQFDTDLASIQMSTPLELDTRTSQPP
jgi:hypothetical protein